jgi:hypothetical protein
LLNRFSNGCVSEEEIGLQIGSSLQTTDLGTTGEEIKHPKNRPSGEGGNPILVRNIWLFSNFEGLRFRTKIRPRPSPG